MSVIALEQVAPRVISGGHKKVLLQPPESTSITPYRGCFVRYRIKSGGSPTLNTIKLENGVEWSYYEAVGSDNFNNRPFGIIDNRPRENDPVKELNRGMWSVLVFDTEDAPVRVAFRVIDDNVNFIPATRGMLGKQFVIYGKSVATAEGTFIIPCAIQSLSVGLVCRQVYPAIVKETSPAEYADYGWVVLDLNYAVEGGGVQQTKFLSFPYVIPQMP